MERVKNILIVGVGGQGIILSSKMLTRALMEQGYDVKMSEIHGMSQRGGSVNAQVRYGDKVYSPVIGLGEADILLSFEEMETYRWLQYLKAPYRVIMNRYRLPSAPILSGKKDYPDALAGEIIGMTDAIVVDAMDIVQKIGVPRCMNMVLLGALVREIGLTNVNWQAILQTMVKEQYIDDNLKALRLGMESAA